MVNKLFPDTLGEQFVLLFIETSHNNVFILINMMYTKVKWINISWRNK